MHITKQQVHNFKKVYCNENGLISTVLRTQLAEKLQTPILDVGAGIGDISVSAFPNLEVVHLDIMDYAGDSLPPLHRRVIEDFFTFDNQGQPIGTVLLCHVLQFLDDNPNRLNKKLSELNPQKLVVVANRNDDLMATLIDWFKANTSESNPETAVPEFPMGYRLQTSIDFTADIFCSEFDSLAGQVCYLMDAELSSDSKLRLRDFLKQLLPRPEFTINESVLLYERVSQ